MSEALHGPPLFLRVLCSLLHLSFISYIMHVVLQFLLHLSCIRSSMHQKSQISHGIKVEGLVKKTRRSKNITRGIKWQKVEQRILEPTITAMKLSPLKFKFDIFTPKSSKLEGSQTYFVLASRTMNLLQTKNLCKFVKSSQDVFTTSRKKEIRSKLALNAINLSIKDTIIPFIIKFIPTNVGNI